MLKGMLDPGDYVTFKSSMRDRRLKEYIETLADTEQLTDPLVIAAWNKRKAWAAIHEDDL